MIYFRDLFLKRGNLHTAANLEIAGAWSVYGFALLLIAQRAYPNVPYSAFKVQLID